MPAGEEKIRFLQLGSDYNERLLRPPDRTVRETEARRFMYDKKMAEIIEREVLLKGKKALWYSGVHHAFTRYRQPGIFFIRMTGEKRRGGNILYDNYGDRVYLIALLAPAVSRWLLLGEYQDVTRSNISFNYVNFPNLKRGDLSNGLNREFYSAVFPGKTEVLTESRMPSFFAMAQNYPNPFNPTTTIQYELPQRSGVTLSVYDALGQIVTTIVQGTEEAGSHKVKFDGSNLASGVYFYRLQAGTFVQSKKFVLLR